jgi:hypothetical protein
MKKLASIVLFFVLSVAHAHDGSYVYAPYATPPVYSHPYSGSPPIYGGRHDGYPANGWHHGEYRGGYPVYGGRHGGSWQGGHGGGPHGR